MKVKSVKILMVICAKIQIVTSAKVKSSIGNFRQQVGGGIQFEKNWRGGGGCSDEFPIKFL